MPIFTPARRRLQVLVGLITLNAILLFLTWPDERGIRLFHSMSDRLLELESLRNQEAISLAFGVHRPEPRLKELGSQVRELWHGLEHAASQIRSARQRQALSPFVTQIGLVLRERESLVQQVFKDAEEHRLASERFSGLVYQVRSGLAEAGYQELAERIALAAYRVSRSDGSAGEAEMEHALENFDQVADLIPDPELRKSVLDLKPYGAVSMRAESDAEGKVTQLLRFKETNPISGATRLLRQFQAEGEWIRLGLEISLSVLVMVLMVRAVILHRQIARLGRSLAELNGELETKFVRRTEELFASEAKLRLILDTASDAVVATDRCGRVRAWNRRAETLLGYPASRAMGARFADLLQSGVGSDAEAGMKVMTQFLDAPSPTHGGLRVSVQAKNAEGRIIPLDVAMSVVGEGEGLSVHAFLRDMTLQKAHEDTLRQARELAESASRAKSDFLATMSHEIRTPMNAILGFTALLQETSLTEEQRDFVTTVQGSGESLLSLINDILDFSKMEAGKMSLEQVRFQPRETMFAVMELLSPKAADQHVDLVIDCHPDVPEWMHGDPNRIQQIAMNLVGNALKFTRQGHVLVEVRLLTPGPADRGGMVRIQVTDTGVGIPEEKQAGLFRKFIQADSSTTRRFGGTGLGLAICRQLTELMGGKIGFQSSEGAGSSFWVDLPLSEEDLKAHQPVPPPDLEGMRILVIASGIHAKVLATQFDRWGIKADFVGCVQTLARCALSELPLIHQAWDVVLMDSSGSGWDFAALRRSLSETTALTGASIVLLVTAAERRQTKAAMNEGCSGFLVKPLVRLPLLEKMLSQLWQLRNGRASTVPIGQEAMLQHGFRAPSLLEAQIQPLARESISGTRRVLLVEDNLNNQRLISRLLEKLGCVVEIAENGRAGASKALAHHYDLILMDCHMPEMNGFEATAVIRDAEKIDSRKDLRAAVPIVAITASALPEERDLCLRNGMNDCLTKPVKFSDLRDAVERWTTPPPAKAA